MRRAALLQLSGFSDGNLKMLARKERLPWSRVEQAQAEAPEEAGWGEYTWRHAAALRATLELSHTAGITLEDASDVVRRGVDMDGKRLPGWYDAVHVSFFGRPLTLDEMLDEQGYFCRVSWREEASPDVSRQVLVGTLNDVLDYINRVARAQPSPNSKPRVVESAVLFNHSACVRAIRRGLESDAG